MGRLKVALILNQLVKEASSGCDAEARHPVAPLQTLFPWPAIAGEKGRHSCAHPWAHAARGGRWQDRLVLTLSCDGHVRVLQPVLLCSLRSTRAPAWAPPQALLWAL